MLKGDSSGTAQRVKSVCESRHSLQIDLLNSLTVFNLNAITQRRNYIINYLLSLRFAMFKNRARVAAGLASARSENHITKKDPKEWKKKGRKGQFGFGADSLWALSAIDERTKRARKPTQLLNIDSHTTKEYAKERSQESSDDSKADNAAVDGANRNAAAVRRKSSRVVGSDPQSSSDSDSDNRGNHGETPSERHVVLPGKRVSVAAASERTKQRWNAEFRKKMAAIARIAPGDIRLHANWSDGSSTRHALVTKTVGGEPVVSTHMHASNEPLEQFLQRPLSQRLAQVMVMHDTSNRFNEDLHRFVPELKQLGSNAHRTRQEANALGDLFAKHVNVRTEKIIVKGQECETAICSVSDYIRAFFKLGIFDLEEFKEASNNDGGALCRLQVTCPETRGADINGDVKEGGTAELRATCGGDGFNFLSRFGHYDGAVQFSIYFPALREVLKKKGMNMDLATVCVAFVTGAECRDTVVELLKPIAQELSQLIEDGIKVEDVTIKFSPTFCSDLKFTNFMRCHKDACARFGCAWCTQHVQRSAHAEIGKRREYNQRTDENRSGKHCHSACPMSVECDGGDTCVKTCPPKCDGSHGALAVPKGYNLLPLDLFVIDLLHGLIRIVEKFVDYAVTYHYHAYDLIKQNRRLKLTEELVKKKLEDWFQKHGLSDVHAKRDSKRMKARDALIIIHNFDQLKDVWESLFDESMRKQFPSLNGILKRFCTLSKFVCDFCDLYKFAYGSDANGHAKTGKPSEDKIEQFAKKAADWEYRFGKELGIKNEVAYVHCFGHHVAFMMRIHGYLGQYSCERIEKKNQNLSRSAQRNCCSRFEYPFQLMKRQFMKLGTICYDAPPKRAYVMVKRGARKRPLARPGRPLNPMKKRRKKGE